MVTPVTPFNGMKFKLIAAPVWPLKRRTASSPEASRSLTSRSGAASALEATAPIKTMNASKIDLSCVCIFPPAAHLVGYGRECRLGCPMKTALIRDPGKMFQSFELCLLVLHAPGVFGEDLIGGDEVR